MNKTIFIEQIHKILTAFGEVKYQSKWDDLSDIDEEKISELLTKAKASVSRIVGNNSEYYKDIVDVLKKTHISEGTKLVYVSGTIKALKDDIENDYLKSVAELIRSDIFSDYLEMSTYLIEEGYKDPAAVLTGSTLESHLRELCKSKQIDTEILHSKGKLVPKKADVMNSDLAKAQCYSATYQNKLQPG